jgi:hypothetical protein
MKNKIYLIINFLVIISSICTAQNSDLFFLKEDGTHKFLFKNGDAIDSWDGTSLQLTTDVSDFKFVISEDFNGDNCKDLFFLKEDGTNKFLFKAEGSDNSWNDTSLFNLGDVSGFKFVISEDFNGDGRKDLFFLKEDGTNKFLLKAEESAVDPWNGTSFEFNTGDVSGYKFVIAEDFNGDGRKDLFFLKEDGTNKFLLKAEESAVDPWNGTSFEFNTGDVSGYKFVIAEDFNGDGRKDLFFLKEDGTNKFLYKNEAAIDSWNGTSFEFNTGDVSGYKFVIAEDFNGDGRKDLFFLKEDGTNKFLYKNEESAVDPWNGTSFEFNTGDVSGYKFVIAEDFNCIISSNENLLLKDKLKVVVFPNPVRENITLEIDSEINAEMVLSINDLSGKKILKLPNIDVHQSVQNYSMPVSGLSNGLYILEYRTKEGIGFQKIIIAK